MKQQSDHGYVCVSGHDTTINRSFKIIFLMNTENTRTKEPAFKVHMHSKFLIIFLLANMKDR